MASGLCCAGSAPAPRSLRSSVTRELLRCETLDGQTFSRLIGRLPKPKGDQRLGVEMATTT